MSKKAKSSIARNNRFQFLDFLRGILLLNMIAYHAVWDLVYLFNINCGWFYGQGSYVWQQAICIGFILLSGFCWSLGKNPFSRGCTVLASGFLITAVTAVFMPEQTIVFGILTLIGSGMVLMVPLERVLERLSPLAGILLTLLLFVITRNINQGTLGVETVCAVNLPTAFYHGLPAAYLGFPSADFHSSDYFPLFPWIFLFFCGYFFSRLTHYQKFSWMQFGFAPINNIGRNSLLIYMFHQPVLYVFFMALLQILG